MGDLVHLPRLPLQQSNAYGFKPLEVIPGQDEASVRPPTSANPERYSLRVWIDGYRIYDRGELIVSIHGPQAALAWKIYSRLRNDDTNGEA